LLFLGLGHCNNSAPPSLPKQVETEVTETSGNSEPVTPLASTLPASSTSPTAKDQITNPPQKVECNGKGFVFDWVKTDPSKTCTTAVIDDSICSQESAPLAFGASANLAKPEVDKAIAEGYFFSPKGCGRFSDGVVILVFLKVVDENTSKKILSKRICSGLHTECP
jgi:hypothetical protein